MVAHGHGPSLSCCSIVSSLSPSPVSQKCLQAWILALIVVAAFMTADKAVRRGSHEMIPPSSLPASSLSWRAAPAPSLIPFPSSLLESVFCPDSRLTIKNVNQPASEPSVQDLPVGFQTPGCPRVLSTALQPCLLPLILTGPQAQPLNCPSLWLSSAPGPLC